MSIPIRESKTDQEKAGVARMPRVSEKLLRPVLAMRAFIDISPKPTNPDACLSPPSFRRKLVLVAHRAAGENGIPTSVANTHSLRAGGATALFSAGVDWVAIQRWGSWKYFVFHQYIRRDHSGFMELWKKIASSNGLNKFLIEVAPLHKRLRFLDEDSDSPLPLSTTGRAPKGSFEWCHVSTGISLILCFLSSSSSHGSIAHDGVYNIRMSLIAHSPPSHFRNPVLSSRHDCGCDGIRLSHIFLW